MTALESITVLWRPRNYRDIIIIIACSGVIIAYVGETVRLHCGDGRTVNRFVVWYFQQQWVSRPILLASGGHLGYGDLRGRLNTSVTALVISNVQAYDSGIYTCIEDVGLGIIKQHHVSLSVPSKQT